MELAQEQKHFFFRLHLHLIRFSIRSDELLIQKVADSPLGRRGQLLCITFALRMWLSQLIYFVTQIRGHMVTWALTPLSPLRLPRSFLLRQDLSIFSPRRLASNCAYARYGAVCSHFSHMKKVPLRGPRIRETFGLTYDARLNR